MAKNRVKGITVQIGGDVTGLDKALKDTNKNISNTQSQLKDVERLLKLDPKNTELLAQKQKLLAQATEETKEKLQVLNNANEQLRDSVGTKVSAAQFDSLQREIVETEQALERLEEKGKVSLEAISTKAGNVSKTFAPVTKAVAALGTAVVATVPGTAELRDGLSKLDNNARMSQASIEASRAAWKELTLVGGDTGSAIEAVSNLLQAQLGDSELERAVRGISDAVLTFPDTLKAESLADSIQETLATGAATGQYAELLERLGYSVEAFNASLSECPDRAARVEEVLSFLEFDLHGTYEAWRANNEEMLANKEATLNLEMSMAKIAETILPIVTEVTEDIADLIAWFAELPDGVKFGIAAFAGLVGAISPVAGTVSNVMGLMDKLSGVKLPKLSKAFSTAAGFIASHPIVLIIAAIAGLVAFIATEGDKIQKGLENMNTFLKDVFAKDWTEVFGPVLGGIMNNFLDMVEGVWDYLYMTFDGVIDFIRGIFTLDLERALNGLVKIFAAPINSIISMINQAIDSINWLIEGANNIPGVNIGTIGHIPLLAQDIGRGATTSSTDMDALNVLSSPTVAQNTTSTTNSTSNTTNVGTVSIMLNAGYGQSVHELAEQISEEIQRMVESEEAKL